MNLIRWKYDDSTLRNKNCMRKWIKLNIIKKQIKYYQKKSVLNTKINILKIQEFSNTFKSPWVANSIARYVKIQVTNKKTILP